MKEQVCGIHNALRLQQGNVTRYVPGNGAGQAIQEETVTCM